MQTQTRIEPVRYGLPLAPPTAENDILVANTVVLEIEDKQAFLTLIVRLRDEYLPADCTEEYYVQNIAVAQWKQQRMALVIRTILEREIKAHTNPHDTGRKPLFTSLEGIEKLKRMHERQARRSIGLLKRLKARRRTQMSRGSKYKTK